MHLNQHQQYYYDKNSIFHNIIIHKHSFESVSSVYSVISGLLEAGPPEPVSESSTIAFTTYKT